MMFGRNITRTQRTVMDACIASFTMLCLKPSSSLIFTSLREAWQRSPPGVPAGPGYFCLLMSTQWRPGCLCWIVSPLLICILLY